MDFLIPKFRRDPNEKVDSLYAGVSPGNHTITTVIKKSRTEDKLEATRTYGPGLQRGQGGRVAILVLGGMETTLDEMEYILQAKQEKKFVPKRTPGDIVRMCELVAERRHDQIKHLKANPSEMPKKKKTVRMYLPVGYRYVPTSEPGLSILARS